MGVVSAGEVELWEAIILFIMYIGYVVLMAYNVKVYFIITGRNLLSEMEDGTAEKDDDNAYVLQEGATSINKKDMAKAAGNTGKVTSFRWPGSFRAGVVKLITKPESWKSTAGTNLVANIHGDVDAVFEHVDKDGNKSVDKDELGKVLEELKLFLSNKEFEELFSELDMDKDGKVKRCLFCSCSTVCVCSQVVVLLSRNSSQLFPCVHGFCVLIVII